MGTDILLYGGIISLVVGFLKRIPLVGNYPKIVAGVLAAVGAFLAQQHLGTFDWQGFFTQLAGQLGVAIGTHEVILAPTGASKILSGTGKQQDTAPPGAQK